MTSSLSSAGFGLGRRAAGPDAANVNAVAAARFSSFGRPGRQVRCGDADERQLRDGGLDALALLRCDLERLRRRRSAR